MTNHLVLHGSYHPVAGRVLVHGRHCCSPFRMCMHEELWSWFICLCWLFHLRKVCWSWWNVNTKIINGKADRIPFLYLAFPPQSPPFPDCTQWQVISELTSFLRFICSPFHLRKRVLILFGFTRRSIRMSLPLSTVCEERVHLLDGKAYVAVEA